MATFLHRLGRWCAQHRWPTIAAWAAVLALTLAGMTTFAKPLSNTFTVPGSRFEEVLETLRSEIPEAAGTTGTVVMRTTSGEPFTEDQKAAVASAVEEWNALEATEAIDPFVAQDELDSTQTDIADGEKQLADGRQELEDGREELEAGEKKLQDGEKELAAGQEEISANEKKLQDAKDQLASGAEQLEAGQAQLDANRPAVEQGRAQLEAGQAELDANAQRLAEGRAQLEAGQAELDANAQRLAEGRAQLEAGQAELDANAQRLAEGRAQLEAGQAELDAQDQQLDAAQAELDAQRQEVEGAYAAGLLPEADYQAALAEIEAAQAQIDEGREQLAAAQAQIDAQREELEAGEAQLAAGQEQLEASRAELEAGEAQLAAGQEQLDASRAELEAGEAQLAAGQQQLDAARSQVESGEQQLAAGQQQLDASRAELEAGQAEVASGEQQLAEGKQELEDGEEELSAAEQKIADGKQELAEGEEELAEGERDLAAGARVAALTEGMRMVTEDGTVAMTQVSVTNASAMIPPETTKAIQAIGAGLQDDGIDITYSKEITDDLSSLMGPGEILGLVLAGVVLLVMLGSLVAAGLPILMALVGVGVGLTGAMALSHWVDMQSITPMLALMLGLAVGIDYSLFLINRHRQQLRQGMPVVDSIALATGTSGNAVTFAGLTVIIALAALVITGIPFLGTMGLVAAATVAVSVLVALTLLPAVLGVAGLRVLPKKWRRAAELGDAHEAAEQAAREADPHRGWAAVVQRHPWVTIAGVLAIVAAMGYPASQLRLGLPDGSSEPAESSAYQTYDTIREEFGAGANGPIIVVAEMDQPVGDGQYELLTAQADIGERLAAVEGVERVVPFGVNDERDVLAFQVMPNGGPADAETVESVHALSDAAPAIGEATGSEIGLTGQTVANIDISEKLGDALPIYLLVVVGLSLVLLLLVFRSVVVPLLATGGFLLSLLASFGAVTAVYQLGHFAGIFQVDEPGPILSFLPILLIGILFGLAMDYQVFLVSAMREEHVHGTEARRAVVTGFNHSARVVTAAAIIMISVFAGFVWAHLAMIRPIGLGLALGVLVDAFLVRMTLTPAVMSLLGERAWWLPRWLDRILPDVDVEGSSLERTRGVHAASSGYAEGPAGEVDDTAELATVGAHAWSSGSAGAGSADETAALPARDSRRRRRGREEEPPAQSLDDFFPRA